MPNVVFKPKDVYAVMNTLYHEITGQDNINVVDTSSFIDAGKTILDYGYDALYEALGVLIGRTIIAIRPYEGKLKLIASSEDAFSERYRKISFYSQDNIASGEFNTDINDNLGKGKNDASGAGSQWEQFPSMPVEKMFRSSATYDKGHTHYIEQAKQAFTNERDFLEYINAEMVEIQNEINVTLEGRNRALILDRIAGTKLLADKGDIGIETCVNMTKVFNDAHGTSYTTSQLLNDHTVAFLECFLARIKNDSDMLTNLTALFHDPLTKKVGNDYFKVLRHTPKDMQRFIYNSRLFTQINLSLAEIFNPGMLDLPQGEGVQYWQSVTDPYKIDIKPALPEGATSSEVEMDIVIGMLFDRDALVSNNRFTGVYSTPVNARHGYVNTFWHYLFSMYNDYSENGIVYYMSDNTTEYFEGDGTEDDFVLTGTATTIVKVTVNGVAKTAGTDYTFASNTVTFTTAPAADAIIAITYK